MQYNAEKIEEIPFLVKWLPMVHLPLRLGNDEIARKTEHKDLGIILDSKLSFKSHMT